MIDKFLCVFMPRSVFCTKAVIWLLAANLHNVRLVSGDTLINLNPKP